MRRIIACSSKFPQALKQVSCRALSGERQMSAHCPVSEGYMTGRTAAGRWRKTSGHAAARPVSVSFAIHPGRLSCISLLCRLKTNDGYVTL